MGASLKEILVGRFFDGSTIESREESEYVTLSVLGNLTHLLNTRQGSVEHLGDYGLPDLSSVYRDMPDSIDRMRLEIQRAIERYEPRLTRCAVRRGELSERDGHVVFLVTGEIEGRRIRLQTSFGGGEPVVVREWDPTLDE